MSRWYFEQTSATRKVWNVRTLVPLGVGIRTFGYVLWDRQRDCYVFDPEFGALFDTADLREIANFIEAQTKERLS